MVAVTPPTPSTAKQPGIAPRAKAAARKSAVKILPKPAGKAPVKKAGNKITSSVNKKTRAAAVPDKVAAAKIKNKLVRDSFTIPKTEYAVLTALKDRALSLTRHVKKSELLRAGIGALNAMHDKEFLETLDTVPSLKTGRPKRDKEAGDSEMPKKD